MTLVYVDTETTGLDPRTHEVWEAAYAVNGGEVQESLLVHTLVGADPRALELNGYRDRCLRAPFYPQESLAFEGGLRSALDGATLVGANPAFDARFLEARWGVAPWRYRLLDIEAYAMPALGVREPVGLAKVREILVEAYGYEIPAPDHSAAADVATLRACHRALDAIYEEKL